MRLLQIMSGGFLTVMGAFLLALGLLSSMYPASLGGSMLGYQLSQIGFVLVVAGILTWFILPSLKRLKIIKH
jgi:hypothetical protein